MPTEVAVNVIYLLAVLCFLLPFATISCQGEEITSLSGFQLVTGATVEQQQPVGRPTQRRVSPDSWFIAAVLLAVGGLAVSLTVGPDWLASQAYSVSSRYSRSSHAPTRQSFARAVAC